MAGNKPQDSPASRISDGLVTLICWVYFIFAFFFFFSFVYLGAWLVSRDRQRAFQRINHLFYRGFLSLLRLLTPSHSWEIDSRIAAIQGSIIVCNHRSYLDPLLLISLLRQSKTIVKSQFFRAPVFGWLVRVSGYLPATAEGRHGKRMLEQMAQMGEYLNQGGNLFVFPEGTRNRGDGIGSFHAGVFKIARMYRCPVQVLGLCNTDKLFPPGRFFFNSRRKNRISLDILDVIESPQKQNRISASALEERVRQVFSEWTVPCQGDLA